MESLIERLLGRPFLSPEFGGGEGGDGGEGDGGGEPAEVAAVEEGPAGDDEGEEPPEDPEEEFDLGEEKVKLPKSVVEKIRPGYMRTADYQRKTQEVAAARRSFEEEREKATSADKEVIAKRGHLAYIEDNITRFNAYMASAEWQRLKAEDPEAANRVLIDFNELQNTRTRTKSDVDQFEQRSLEAQRAVTSKRIEEASAVLHRDIPNWSTIGAKVADFAIRELGYTVDDLQAMADPRLGKALHRAWRSSQLEAAQKAAAAKKPAEEEAEPIRPATRVVRGNAAATTGLSDRLPTDAWMERRNKQAVKSRAARR